jgi:hypothetical protein
VDQGSPGRRPRPRCGRPRRPCARPRADPRSEGTQGAPTGRSHRTPGGCVSRPAARQRIRTQASGQKAGLPEICQRRRLALPHTAPYRSSPPQPLSCDDVVRRGVRRRRAWWPRSLHTAEATGSEPVTPTSQNAHQAHSNGPFARRSARGSRARVPPNPISVAGPEPRRVNEPLRRRAVDSVCSLLASTPGHSGRAQLG